MYNIDEVGSNGVAMTKTGHEQDGHEQDSEQDGHETRQ